MEPGLAETIRAKILIGELPAKKFDRTWYGRGQGDHCSVCALPITTNQIEVEGDLDQQRGVCRFHNDCFDVWRAEIDKH
jgi:hypothetical protein